nr:NeuD/PglB/VioB family sugar acetyltransferase [uncultured Allomuricauda sp.]
MNNKSVIVGAGTYGQLYSSYLLESGIEIEGFIDDDPNLIGKKFFGIPVIGNFKTLEQDWLKKSVQNVYCPIGNNEVREKYLIRAKQTGYNTPSFVHNTACVGPDVQLGEANYVLPGSIIMPHTIIGDYFMLSIGSTVCHHVIIGNSVFISSGAHIGANLSIKRHAFIGIGATIKSNINEIGEKSLIGAGAVVIRDVEPGTTVVGNPGRVLVKA